eukprot:187976-Lingulodinium_polyedra.AAC.1
MAGQRQWHVPVGHKVLSTRHSYEEVPWQSVSLGRGDPKSPGWGIHVPPTGGDKTSMNMRSIVGSKSAKAAWPTLSPGSFSGLPAQLAVLEWCHDHNLWSKVGDHKWCQLAQRGLVVRRRGEQQ